MDIRSSVTNAPGTLYKLDIPDADAAKFLDWDAPLSKQPESVQKALEGLNPYRIEYGRLKLGGLDIGGPAHKEELAGYWKGATESGESVMRVLEQAYGSKKAASEVLRKAGIPGLRYFDRMSRNDKVQILPRKRSTDGQKVWLVDPGWKDPNKRKTFSTKAEAEAYADDLYRTRNYVIWDQDVLDRAKILDRE
jgi:hypothetical protein